MAIVQDTANTYGSGASAALSFVSPTTAGNAIVVAVSTYNGAAGGMHASAVTDNNGNTYTRIEARGPVGVNATALFLALNIAGRSGHQITCAPSDDASQFFTLAIAELDEIPTSSAVDVSVNAAGSSAAPTANLVTTVADTILIGVISHDANTASNRTYTIGSGYTELYNHGNGGVAPPLFFQTKQVASATTHAFDASLNSTAPWMIAAMALVVDTGGATYTGSAAITLPAMTASGSGTFTTPNYSATAAVTLPAMTASGAGTFLAPGGVLALDTFTATTGTLVTDRQSDSGHDWVMQTGSFDTTPFIITSNRARSQVGGTNVGLLDYTPATDDYEVLAQVYRHDDSEWAIWGRASATDGDGYSLFWSGSRFDLYRYVNDSGTLIGNSDEHASGLSLSDDTLYWVKIRYEIVSTNVVITAWIRTDAAGEDTYTLMLDVTDSDGARHQAAGLAGLNMRNTGATGGMHTDLIRVQEVGTSDAGVAVHTGTAAVALPALTAAGTGTHTAPTYTGTAAPSLPALTAAGTGTHTAPTYTGSAAVTLPALTADGAGTQSSEYLGDGAATLPTMTASGTGTHTAPTYTGSATITLPALTADGTGIFATALYEATAALALPVLTVTGSGAFTAPTYSGSAAVSLPLLTVVGAGTHSGPVFTGSGAVSLVALTAAGVGTFTEDGFDPINNPSGAWSGDGRAGAWSGGKRGAWG